MYNNNVDIPQSLVKRIVVGIGILVVVFVGMAFAIPWYHVWSQEMEGKAEFAKAEQNRKIKIEEAKANLEAEKLNANSQTFPTKPSFTSRQKPIFLFWNLQGPWSTRTITDVESGFFLQAGWAFCSKTALLAKNNHL